MFPSELRLERLETVDSTQAAVRRELERSDDSHGLVVRALSQTHGRGRMRRPWDSGSGGSYQTVAIRDPEGTLRSGRVPIAVAVGIAEALAPAWPRVGLKWPNDLYMTDGRAAKLGGILCEHVRGHLLVGVGVNVRNETPDGAAALSEADPDEVSDLVLAGVRVGLDAHFPDLGLPRSFARFDILLDRRLRVVDGDRELSGSGAGVGSGGCLLVATEAGQVETCAGRVVEFDAAGSGGQV
jgi:BirA family biotin operon repressor/biotin-[acetyl-CoA-carboxylase] ligase